MKTKISILFLIIAVLVVFLFLGRQQSYFFGPEPSQESVSDSLSKEELLRRLVQDKWVSYRNVPAHIKSEIESVDLVVVHFWASWCAPCVNEVPELIRFAQLKNQKEEDAQRVYFITVSLDDSIEEIGKFLKSFPEFERDPFNGIWDRDKKLSKLVNADRLPMTAFLHKGKPNILWVRGVVEWKNLKQ